MRFLLLFLLSFPALADKIELYDVGAYDVTSTSAVIGWTCNAPCRGFYKGDITNAPGETSLDYTTHRQHVEGLLPDTEYRYKIEASLESGDTIITYELRFKTLP
ncbi:MAG: hypothetical protein WC465_04840 [Patescibacteria group bacterium]